MTDTPDFSIIVPIYNTEKYLDNCIKSLLNQTYENIEIILVDDGSTDGSGLKCEQYKAVDNRIKVIHKKNGGLSDARNAGIEVASGRYIMFVDSDDYIEENACEQLYPTSQHGCEIIIASGEVSGAGRSLLQPNIPTGMYETTVYMKAALKLRRFPMAAVLYILSSNFLRKNNLRFKKGILHEDEQFTPRAFLASEYVNFTGVSFYHYQVREGSITAQKDLRKNAEDLYETCVELSNIYQDIPDRVLRKYLLNSLTTKYLSIYQDGALYRYGRQYDRKPFLLKNAHTFRNRIKVLLFCISPKLYWNINHLSKVK